MVTMTKTATIAGTKSAIASCPSSRRRTRSSPRGLEAVDLELREARLQLVLEGQDVGPRFEHHREAADELRSEQVILLLLHHVEHAERALLGIMNSGFAVATRCSGLMEIPMILRLWVASPIVTSIESPTL